ncbi:hypothetical protein AMATHDRAFT_70282 [Amanita thiersii Skay4041]|uniref:Uncharacterized protein n=1 Tax=Amanita thiersii Skay4041 TaxID=703135 RepID=A0A2A9NA99_9AGAR|nr:hypothetical protein AMATHDRAFT_70282 [Amanita thiersii Skay4041]
MQERHFNRIDLIFRLYNSNYSRALPGDVVIGSQTTDAVRIAQLADIEASWPKACVIPFVVVPDFNSTCVF